MMHGILDNDEVEVKRNKTECLIHKRSKGSKHSSL